MITVSDTWNELRLEQNHYYETRIRLNGTYYGQDNLISVKTEQKMFASEQPSVGGCLSGELTLSMLKPTATIPRMAEIKLYARIRTDSRTAEWIPQGTYYIDTRETTNNDDGLPVLTIHAYDSMLKAEQMFPSTESGWPKSDINTVKLIAYYLGLQSSSSSSTGVDPRTIALMTHGYSISAPAGYTMRETLGNIAAMYAGNWVISMENKLLLIPINGIPEETSLIVDEAGNIITFGEEGGEEVAISIVSTV